MVQSVSAPSFRKKDHEMKISTVGSTLALVIGSSMIAQSAIAAEVLVSGNITTSTTWTADNTYNLQGQVYVLPGATLTIQAGVVVASDAGGSLAVTRDARLVCNGNASSPVIFTSKTDKNTWTAQYPRGQWRPAANEWGNITIMGNGYIGKYGAGAVSTNTAAPNAGNYANMEGLTASGSSDTRTFYGGGDDLDNSGSLTYTQISFGGLVVGLGNELNGLSLGGIGRSTTINHIEIMNNVDDGIEVWGGTVDMKYVSVWNIGDDSFDVDHGWRGRAQFGLIVQGYSIVGASSGSGTCDSIFEFDGAAKSDAQPVTTANLYNFTAIGQPLSGKHACKFRDNARVQYNQSIFMDLGGQVVRADNTDGEATDGQTGYGYNGTLSWANTWTTAYNVTSTVNPFSTPAAIAAAYRALSAGTLIQYTDNVFFNNNASAAYTEANARGVFAAANNNVQATLSPITSITRGTNLSQGGGVIQPVIGLDPRAANNAVTSAGTAPNDGFFDQVNYRGGFSPTSSWLCGWTASEAFGYTTAGCSTPCPADLNGDRVVGGADLGALLGNWNGSGTGDLNGDGTVTGSDLGAMLGAWGACAE